MKSSSSDKFDDYSDEIKRLYVSKYYSILINLKRNTISNHEFINKYSLSKGFSEADQG